MRESTRSGTRTRRKRSDTFRCLCANVKGSKAAIVRLQMAVTSLIASLNPAIVARQNTGIDSEEVRA